MYRGDISEVCLYNNYFWHVLRTNSHVIYRVIFKIPLCDYYKLLISKTNY